MTYPYQLHTPKEAAKFLGVSPRWLRSLAHRGKIRPVRIGRSVRYTPAELASYVSRLQETGFGWRPAPVDGKLSPMNERT